jgi:hypothetical protein
VNGSVKVVFENNADVFDSFVFCSAAHYDDMVWLFHDFWLIAKSPDFD